jgi:hypothetical protein
MLKQDTNTAKTAFPVVISERRMDLTGNNLKFSPNTFACF